MDCAKTVMTIKIKFLSFFIFSLFFLSRANGYTVDQLISIAEKNNPELLKIQKELNVLKKKVKVAKRLFNPSISVSLKGDKLLKEPLESGRIYIKQYVPYPKKLDIQRNIEKKRYLSDYYLLVSKKENIFSQIYQSAYKIWFIDENIKAYKHLLSLLEKIKNPDKKEDKLRVSFIKDYLKIKIKNQIYEKKVQLSKLTQLVNKEVTSVSIKPAQVKEIKISKDTLLEKIKESPFYKSVEADIDKAKEVYRLTKLVYYPDFTISARIDTGGSLTDALSVGIGVKIPIWRTIKQEQEVLSKSIEVITEKEKLMFIYNQLKYEIEKSLSYIQLAKDILPVLRKNTKNLKKEFLIRAEKDKDAVLFLKPLEDLLNLYTEINRNIYEANTHLIKIKAVLGEL